MADEDEKVNVTLPKHSSARSSGLHSPVFNSPRSNPRLSGHLSQTHNLSVDDDEDDTEIEESRSATIREAEGEWIECLEIVSGRHLFYNSITMEIVFDRDPTAQQKRIGFDDKRSTKQAGDAKDGGDDETETYDARDISSQDIAAEDVEDDEIVKYLLKFDQSKWEFKNENVEIYRLQINNIDHRLMLPHPISMSFPEYFSTNPIPKKATFLASILPPKDSSQFPTTTKRWTVQVKTLETTAKQLIDKIVEKLKISLVTSEYGDNPNDIISKSSEFILKVVGAEEYLLYDDTKFIIDYEAVRKAVRNEDDVVFQLDHRPDAAMIEQECFDKNIWHISKFRDKYFTANLLTEKIAKKHNEKLQSLLYVNFSYGDGKSLTEIALAQKHNGFTQPYQLKQHQLMMSNHRGAVSDDEDDIVDYKIEFNRDNDIPPPPSISHAVSSPPTQNRADFSFKAPKSVELKEDPAEEPPDTPDPDKGNDSNEQANEDNDVPPPPPLPANNSNGKQSPADSFTAQVVDKDVSVQGYEKCNHVQYSDSNAPYTSTAHTHSPTVASLRAVSNAPFLSNNAFSLRQRSNSNPTPSMNTNHSAPPNMGVSRSVTTRSRKGSVNRFQTDKNRDIIDKWKMKMSILSGKEILSHIPSQHDTQFLLSKIPSKAEQMKKGGIKEMLFHEFAQFYRIKMSFLGNVTHLPRYKHYMQTNKVNMKKLTIVVRHELWIGDLKYDSTTFDTDYHTKISDGMKLNRSFNTSRQKFCDLARESCVSLTVFLCTLKKELDDKQATVSSPSNAAKSDAALYEEMIPIAFSRFPIIDVSNLLRDGQYSLDLWPIPIYIAEYKGAKCDPYINLAFKYRGTTIPRRFKQVRKSKLARLTGSGDDHSAAMEAMKQTKLVIEFEKRPYKVIAPPLNHRMNYKAANLKRLATTLSKQEMESHQKASLEASKVERKASFFGFGKKDKEKENKKKEKEEAKRKQKEWARVNKLVNTDMLHEFDEDDRALIWEYRDDLCKMPDALNPFLRCVDWRDPAKRSEAYDYMEKWTPSPYLENSLELLSYEYMDTHVREYSVMRIAQMSDSDLQRYLLQLVQCLKYEIHHNNALIRLLMRRALSNPLQIGHFFFWHVKSEYLDKLELNIQYLERFGLYLEEYLLFSQIGHARDILIQCNLCRLLSTINSKLRIEKKVNKSPKEKIKSMLHEELTKLNRILPNTFALPINPRWRCTEFVVDECKTMSSAQMPLWLSCSNVDESVGDQNTIIMFKTGDDLRQDILTLQILRVMDKIWLDRGLNLRLLPYNVVSTGDGQGMVEIVLNARTTTWIHTHYGGGAQKGARDITTHLKYINEVNSNNITYVNKARDIYSRSCAGYCIASYVLGLGDRHPSNIMVRTKGELFHIDFSHFLGNFKSQNIIGEYVKWQREVAPFVFLPAYKHCIDNGNKDPDKYAEFLTFAVNAYLALRVRHKLLLNLFILMLPSQMPELIQKNHIGYLRDQLHLPASDPDGISKKHANGIKNEDVYQHILKIVDVCLKDKRRIIDNTFHAIKHA